MSPPALTQRVARAQAALHAGRLDEACALAQHLTRSHPALGAGWGLLAEALTRMAGREAEAAAAYRRALALQAAWPDLRGNYAALLTRSGEHEAALEQCAMVLAAQPGHAMAQLVRAEALVFLGRADEALADLESLTARLPGFAQAWTQLAMLQVRRREPDAAVDSARRAVQADPAFALARLRLAEALCETGRTGEALAQFDAAAALAPGLRPARSKRLLALACLPHVELGDFVRAHVGEGARIAAEAGRPLPPPGPRGAQAGRIRVGYVSGDFVQHAVSYFFTPVLLAHDRAKVSVHAYSTRRVAPADAARVRPLFDTWTDCSPLSDAEMAQRIRADGIDVLIDLSGHSAHHRLGAFALRPARVHWQWFGYPMLTGLDAFDARLTDRWLDPPGSDVAGEKLLRLPSRLAWSPTTEHPPVADTPCLAGQPFTFGSFNALNKMHAGLLDTWAAILRAVPGSRLRMGHMDSPHFEHGLRERFAAAGVDPSRLEALPSMKLADYLRAHDGVDLLLDAFPYNGGTTTIMSLWQGVPVLSLAGRYGVQRVSASLELQIGLEELVVPDLQQYVAKAVALAREPLKLQAWREGMRSRIANAPLGQPALVVGALESMMAGTLGA